MQFDIDVARRILLAIEATPANQYPEDVVLPDVDENDVLEHLECLIEDGLVDGTVAESGMGGDGRILAVHLTRLTRKGHDFLANARNDQVWNKTKVFVKEKGGAVSFEILKAVLIKMAAQHFGTTP
jgi:predicted ArsR family transcriptional regulator